MTRQEERRLESRDWQLHISTYGWWGDRFMAYVFGVGAEIIEIVFGDPEHWGDD